MASKELPEWFVNFINDEQEKELPDWFTGFIHLEQETVEEDIPRVEALGAKEQQEGIFITQLLSTVRSVEAPRFGYDSWYGRGTNSGPTGFPNPPTQTTLKDVLGWQVAARDAGAVSTAVGIYQIIYKTLKGLIEKMGLTGDELFDQDLQERMGLILAEEAGLKKFLSGEIDGDTYAENIAKVWAAVPVLKATKRGNISIAPGQSYWKNVAGNKALLGPKRLEVYRELYSLADRSIGE